LDPQRKDPGGMCVARIGSLKNKNHGLRRDLVVAGEKLITPLLQACGCTWYTTSFALSDHPQ
jgi:hypothetical protein